MIFQSVNVVVSNYVVRGQVPDLAAASAFPEEFQDCVEQGNNPPDLIFNVDGIGLYWKKLPLRTFISQEERSA